MKKSAWFFGFCACFLLFALLRFPEAMLAASAESTRLFLMKVFPSLFPFLAACGLLLRIGAAEGMGAKLRPLMQPLFGLPGIAAFPFFLGLLSGYPMGAKITAMLYEKKQITLPEAEHILAFCNNPGPLFLIGTIGVGFFGIPACGYLLLLSSFLGAVATGILWRFSAKPAAVRSVPSSFALASSAESSLTEALASSVADAVNTLLLIGGYLILFGAFSKAMEELSLFSLLSRLLFFLPLSEKALAGFCSGLMEMTNGAYLLSLAPDGLRLRLSLAAFLLSSGGLSILGQTLGILREVPISKGAYLKAKCLHGACSSLFCYLLTPFLREILQQSAQKAVPVCSFFSETAFTLSFLWSLPSLFFLGVLCHALLLKRRK